MGGKAARFANQALRIRLARFGCTNRPFYHVVVAKAYRPRDIKPIEQIGTIDPIPNNQNEILVAINFEKLHQWLNRGALPTPPVAKVLGLSGFFPLHYMTPIEAKRNKEYARKRAEEEAQKEKDADTAVETEL